MKEITLKKLEKPFEKTTENDIYWLCQSLGFYGGPKKNQTTAQIFMKILDRASKNQGVTTAEINKEIGISRVAAISHLNKLIDAGLIVRDKIEYRLRSPNLTRTLREVTKDLTRILKDMGEVVDEIDDDLGLKKRRTRKETNTIGQDIDAFLQD